LKGLQSGKIIGACLDVLENEEPLNFNDLEKNMYGELFEMDSVLLSPHVAGWSAKSKVQMESFLLANITKALDL
jgi:D-3-phosphoglycerate dehydrogenase